MNYALIKNNVVVNTVVCNSDNDAKKLFPDYTVINITGIAGNDSNLLIVFYVQIMPDDLVMQLHRF